MLFSDALSSDLDVPLGHLPIVRDKKIALRAADDEAIAAQPHHFTLSLPVVEHGEQGDGRPLCRTIGIGIVPLRRRRGCRRDHLGGRLCELVSLERFANVLVGFQQRARPLRIGRRR
jgi:hypothetical protein